VIDSEVIWQQGRIDRDITRKLLIELETASALVRRLFWICPAGRGTTAEASSLGEFPPVIECHRCGNEHSLQPRDLEVKFLPSESLLHDVYANS
jgi:hypothetical protein